VPRLRAQVIAEYGQHCWLCGTWIPLEQFSIDHVIHRSNHGTDDLSNLRPAHLECNKRRGTRWVSRLPAPRRTTRPIPPPSRPW
jgi:5-methylcytosine-specific restriction endonuclease McrA